MSYFHRVLAAVVLWAAYCSSGAAAQLTGSTVNVSAYYPDVTTVYADPGNVVVSDMIEYPSGSLFPYSGSWQIDLGASQMSITDLGQNGFPFAPETFNGFILRLVSGPAILSASVDPTSQFVPVSLTVEGGNRVLANY